VKNIGFFDIIKGNNDTKSDEIYQHLVNYQLNEMHEQGFKEALSACKRFPNEGCFFFLTKMFYYLKEKDTLEDLISSDKCLTTIKYYKKANKLYGNYSYSNLIAGIYKDDLHDYENAIVTIQPNLKLI